MNGLNEKKNGSVNISEKSAKYTEDDMLGILYKNITEVVPLGPVGVYYLCNLHEW